MISINGQKCDLCGTCVAVCPVDAVEVLEYNISIDEGICTQCQNCIAVCPWSALEMKE